MTDLVLTGEIFITRAEADPYFPRPQAAGLVHSYLGDTDPKNPLASPLYVNLAGLPAIRVHVGGDEVLLDDSRRYVERAVAAGVDATLDMWMGVPHGFINGVGNWSPPRRHCHRNISEEAAGGGALSASWCLPVILHGSFLDE